MVKHLDNGIKPRSSQGSHIGDGPDSGSTTSHGASATPFTAIPVPWRHAYQAGDLVATERAQFGQFGHQGATDSRSHTGNTLQELILFTPSGSFVNQSGDLFFQMIKLFFNSIEQLANTVLYVPSAGLLQAVGFRRVHGHQLSAAGDKFLQKAFVFRGKGPNYRTHVLGEKGQHAGVDPIGLGQDPGGPGKIANLPGVEN